MTGAKIADMHNTEDALLREIVQLELQAAALGDPSDWGVRGIQLLYRINAQHRKRLLAAIRDGRPEAWAEY